MRGKALFLAGWTATLVVLIGCHHDKYGIAYKVKEKCVLPPEESRYSQPPEAEYRAPRPKSEDKALLGKGGNKMAGPLAPGGF